MNKRLIIADAVREKIITGDFAPSEGIPEESIAAEFAVSRTPVREALISLETQHLVTSEANRGFRVATVSIELIRAYFETSRMLYPGMFQSAFDRLRQDALGNMRAVDAAEAAMPPELLHFTFVESIAAQSRNAFSQSVAAILEGYHAFTRGSVLRGMSEREADAAERDLALHRANILDAMEAEDRDHIEDAVIQMTEGLRVFLLSNLV